jgi:uncharacterized membrane protein YesL
MILFLIKKTFFDMWDNLLSIFLLNVGFLLVAAGGFYLISFMNHVILFLVAAFFALVALCLYTGVVAMMTRDMANYHSLEIRNFWPYLKETWKTSTVFALIILAQLIILRFVMPWYLSRGNLLGLAVASLLFWVSLTWWLASQYYFPIRAQLDTEVKKVFRKCFVLFFDNTLFSIVLALGAIVLVVLSGFVVFLIPGMTTLLLWHQVAFKLRMYKYDYLEAHPNANRKQIPWNDLLYEDRERVGHRSLRGMIFPWKD